MQVRWAAVALVAAVSVAAVMAAGVADERRPAVLQECWRCHANDQNTGPFTTSVQLIADEAGAEVGKPFALTTTLQKAWNKQGPNGGYKIMAADVTIDLRQAPSLQFNPDVDDYHESKLLNITLDPTRLTERQGASAPVLVPTGVSRVTLTITPVDRTENGPDLRLTFGPTGQGASITKDEAGRGGVEVIDLPLVDAAPYLGTIVDIGADTVLLDTTQTPPSLLTATSVSFTAELVASYDIQFLRVLSFPVTKVLQGPGASVLMTWPLLPIAQPQPGERITFVANSTGYGDHPGAPNTSDYVDWGNFTDPAKDGVLTPFVMDVTARDGQVVLVPQETVIVRPSVQNGASMATVSEAVGYAAAFLLLSSIASGGIFGKASRRSLNTLFGSAKRRVAFHNFLSYGIILAASVHTVLFIIEAFYAWTLGLIWGGLAILAMLGLGLTGALQVAMIRRWSYGFWRWSHYGLTIAVLVFTVVHMLLDGVHFADVQSGIGWKDPLRDFVV